MIINISGIGQYNSEVSIENQEEAIINYIVSLQMKTPTTIIDEDGDYWHVNDRVVEIQWDDLGKNVRLRKSFSYINPIYSPDCMAGLTTSLTISSILV